MPQKKQNKSQNNKTTKDKFRNNRVTVLVWKQNGEGGYVRTLNLLIKITSSVLHDGDDTSLLQVGLQFGIFVDLMANSCPAETRKASF